MNFLDTRTVLFSYVITNAICAVVMDLLWRQNRKRSPELGFWLADFILQFAAVLLIALRGIVPDFISILLGSPLVILGTLLLYIGLERYTGKTGPQLHNYILVGIVFVVQAYFTFIRPSLQARNVLLSLGLLALCSQCAWLLLRRANSEGRPAMRAVGAVFLLYSLVNIIRVLIDLVVPAENDLFNSGVYDTLAILYQMLFIGLTFALMLMVDQRLFIALESDIIERKRVEGFRRESEERYQSLFENMLNGLAFCRMIFNGENPQDFIYLDVNHAFETQTGLKDVVGRKVSEVIPGILESDRELIELYGRVARTGSPEAIEIFVDALKMWFSISVYSPQKEYFVASFDVITERKRAEEEIRSINAGLEQRVEARTLELRAAQEKLVRQERLAVLGQLAGGVGHELRNPLSVINNSIYYLRLIQPDADEKVNQYLGIIEQEVQHAGKIINDLLGFGRADSVEREPVAVARLVHQTLVRFPVPATLVVSLDLPDDLPEVFADPRQVEQVLGNLVTNACQAMAARAATGVASQSSTTGVAARAATGVLKKGTLSISARLHKNPSGNIAPGGVTAAGDGGGSNSRMATEMVAIAVNDTGTGITPENMKQLFEPLFTTRARGIGLGLAVSRKLAEANGGRIEVQSEVGQGSTFTIYLPVDTPAPPRAAGQT